MTYADGDALQNSWPDSSRRVEEKWGQLTDNDVKSIGGRSEYLVSRLQERYGYSRERAEQECQTFLDELEAVGYPRRNGARVRAAEPASIRAFGSPAPQSGSSRSQRSHSSQDGLRR
jgi:uncharacterized protein YjbJ (UPF0337 family)